MTTLLRVLRFALGPATGYATWRSIRLSSRSSGTFRAVAATTASVMHPPKITEGTVPINRAAAPDSNAPSSFELPMKIAFTAETRPINSVGVRT